MAVARQGPRGTTAAVEKQHGQAAGSGERHDLWGCAASCGGGKGGQAGCSRSSSRAEQQQQAMRGSTQCRRLPLPGRGQARCSRSWKAPPTAGRRLAGAPLNARCADGKTVEKARSSVDAANDAGIRLLPMIPLGYSTRTIHYQYHPYHAACHCQRITPPSLLLQGGREGAGGLRARHVPWPVEASLASKWTASCICCGPHTTPTDATTTALGVVQPWSHVVHAACERIESSSAGRSIPPRRALPLSPNLSSCRSARAAPARSETFGACSE